MCILISSCIVYSEPIYILCRIQFSFTNKLVGFGITFNYQLKTVKHLYSIYKFVLWALLSIVTKSNKQKQSLFSNY